MRHATPPKQADRASGAARASRGDTDAGQRAGVGRQARARAFVAGLALFAAPLSFIVYGAQAPIAVLSFALAWIALAAIAAALFGPDRCDWPFAAGVALAAAWHVQASEAARGLAAPHLAALAGAGALWLIAARAGRDRTARHSAGRALMAGGLALAVFLIVAARAPHGIGPGPGTTGFASAALLLFGYARLMQTVHRRWSMRKTFWDRLGGVLRGALGACALLPLSGLALVLSGEPGAALGAALGLAALTVFELAGSGDAKRGPPLAGPRKALAWAFAAIAGLAAVAAASGAASAWSPQAIGAAAQLVLDAPVSGVGLGAGTRAVAAAASMDPRFADAFATGAAPAPVRWALETGAAGAAAAIAGLVWAVAGLSAPLRKASGSATLGAFGLVLTWLVLAAAAADLAVATPAFLWSTALLAGWAHGHARGAPDGGGFPDDDES